jgi:MYXO-CTERM domain-containing protein
VPPAKTTSSRARLAACAAFCATLAASHGAFAQATLMSGLGGTVGYGNDCMPACDDCSSPYVGSLDITPAFPSGLHFYGGTYASTYINNNGNISFLSPVATFTPDAFPGASQPMIAPFWADVDTRDEACDAPLTTACANPTTDGVWWSLAPGQLVVTWDHVGYYQCRPSPTMTFQLILTATSCSGGGDDDGGTTGTNFDIEFRYAECGWEVGDSSGGQGGFCPPGTQGVSCTPAQAGFDSAESPDVDYASLPFSRMNGIAGMLCAGSNLSPPQAGVWRFAVRGGSIMCPTAGAACTTSKPGICAQGTLQCGATGATSCASVTAPRAKQCNGLDNDCDGKIDDGPCPAGTACDGTACVSACIEGGCPTGKACSNGLCVEAACASVTCTAGERCAGGKCVDPCSGVVCPLGQACREGSCADPCAALTCGTGQVCDEGTCKAACPCGACAASETCVTTGSSAGHCEATACAGVTCPAGRVCSGGSCVDPCKGAVCPAGETCSAGTCSAPNAADAGADSGVGLRIPDASAASDASAGGGGGEPLDATASDDDGSDGAWAPGKKSGCACRAAGGPSPGGLPAVVFVLGLAAAHRRRVIRPSRRASRAPS